MNKALITITTKQQHIINFNSETKCSFVPLLFLHIIPQLYISHSHLQTVTFLHGCLGAADQGWKNYWYLFLL